MKQVIPRQRLLVAALAAAALLSVSAGANATVIHYVTHFTTLNDSGVTGSAGAWFNSDTSMLKVHISASGLQPNETHPQHIHGPSANGVNLQATVPTLAADDANGDGVLEVLEGATAYGPILVPLTPFQTAANGTIDYTNTFDVNDPGIYFTGASEADLFPLNLREIVIHGLNAPINITNGGLNGTTDYAAGTYDPFLPVAAGVLVTAVPEPADLGMMAGGLGLLFGLLWLRRKGSLHPDDA